MYENYDRNGKKAWVRSDLKGRQKEFCMNVSRGQALQTVI